ncbi:hypothetical protein SAMN05518845_11571 [Variovorax sp. YR750]|uniref:hypothetical protein n=1 Tax=Variovorax sp. YR750 TaxID=1884384 RepID=UPI0008C1BE77|nr:hypothetical protein [Variovorax sp. YR750]SEM04498.1 hypothetical protein SAMN05518845_11571 [Variovorax sp. YR750]
MNKSNRTAMDSIRALALRDLEATSDEEIRAEIVAQGEDPDAAAQRIRARIDAIMAEAMRARTIAAKKLMGTTAATTQQARPTIDRIKQLIQEAFRSDAGLAMAFREGTQQSDADLESLYDDLVAMGKIKRDDNGH